MSLKVNLRHLEDHGMRLKGELPVAELDLGVTDELVFVGLRDRFEIWNPQSVARRRAEAHERARSRGLTLPGPTLPGMTLPGMGA